MSFHDNDIHSSNKKPLTLINNESADSNNNNLNDLTFSSNHMKLSGKKQEIILNGSNSKKPSHSNSFTSFSGKVTEVYPEYDASKNYYQEFWKIYLHNEVMIAEMREFVEEIKQIKIKIQQTEESHLQFESVKISRASFKKKNRRTADEISKEHICPYPKCNKAYGSDVSLNLHIKLKHGGGNKTEREKLARAYLLAEMSGDKIPSISLCLPPGYLEKFKKQCPKKNKFKKDSLDGSFSLMNEESPENSNAKPKKEMNI